VALANPIRLEKGGFRWLDSGQGGFHEVASLDSTKESSTPRSWFNKSLITCRFSP